MIYVLHYRDVDVTLRCLGSLAGQGEVVVIDNGSETAFGASGCTIMRLEKTLGVIAAFNVAMRRYPADWYLCLNNDTVASPGMVDRLAAALANPDYGIVAPGSSDQGAGILYVPYPSSEWPDAITPHVDNHAWAFTQDVIDAIGYPDAEGHPHWANWYANRLYCWKARNAGYQVVAVRSAYVEHIHANGYNQEADRVGYQWICDRLGARVGEAL